MSCALRHRHLLILLLAAAGTGLVWGETPARPKAAKPSAASREQQEDICTDAPRSEWLAEDEMRLLAEHRGYRIKTFKIANGSCYEIYGFDRQGQIVEAYFNPVTSRLVRQNIAR
ncbi:MAG: PepSY domain-containing protein [Hydrogenophaga sp.]|nr:PepSY domain-containing protein [Hydrogenophaga sp.]